MANKKNIGDLLWEEVKSAELDLYGITGQKVEASYERLPVEPSKLYLRLKNPRATASLAALENALNPGNPANHKFVIIASENNILTITKKEDISGVVQKFDEQKEAARLAAAMSKKTSG